MVDETLPLSDLNNGVTLDPEAIETTTNLKAHIDMEIKCSFCTKARRKDLTPLEESKENKFMVNLLERCISEMQYYKKIENLFGYKAKITSGFVDVQCERAPTKL